MFIYLLKGMEASTVLLLCFFHPRLHGQENSSKIKAFNTNYEVLMCADSFIVPSSIVHL